MKPMEGIRVVEVASWTFVPAAGAVLAEWGAEVFKIEHPEGGDPQRGLVASGLVPGATAGFNFFVEQPNHGKKSVAIDIQHPEGRAALLKLCETADVFLTNLLAGPRRRAQVDVEHIRAVNPDIVISNLLGGPMPKMTRETIPNPLVNRYVTKDGRLIALVMLQGVRFWPETITALGRPDLADDERFTTPQALAQNAHDARKLLDDIFATRTYDEWKAVLDGVKGVWAPVQRGIDLHDDPQAIANGYIAQVPMPDGATYPLVTNPTQFDEQPNEVTRAPELGEHTDDVLRSLGYDDEQIIALKLAEAIL